MTSPIPITPTSPPSQSAAPPNASPTGASSLSLSPQTPFFPPPGSISAFLPPSPPNNAKPAPAPGYFRWPSTMFGRSPLSPPLVKEQGFDIPTTKVNDEDQHHEEHHDSFEFGDFSGWGGGTGARRAASMSLPSGERRPSGIASMLAGFGGEAAGSAASGGGGGPAGGVMADKVAKGHGVLRRLSMSGSFSRPTFMSPPTGSTNLPPSPPAPTPITPAPPAMTSAPQAEPVAQLERARTVSNPVGFGGRGRRYSESGTRKRGVSPMGERLLRDHGHF